MQNTGLIFDMDGTLWDSASQVALSWSEVIKTQYPEMPPITEADMKRVMGKTMDQLAAALFPQLPVSEQLALCELCCLHENDYLRNHGASLYPEVEETLQLLQKNHPLYIVSNCQSGYIEAFLAHYHFEKYFEDIECFGNNGLKKADNIKKIVARNHLEHAIYIGDIQGDYDASMEAGVDFIHAAYGFGVISQPVKRIQRFGELPALLMP